jgi:23S rRNA (guanosine2251-2'-O)-methyltransferase
MAAAASEDLASVLERKPNLILLVDGVEDPHNLGAVLRTAEAVGVGGVVLPKRHSCGISAAVVKASAGAALHLPVARVVNVARALGQCKEAGYWTVGLDMGGAQSVSQLDTTLPLVLVVGGEDRGLRRLVKEKCDFLVALPLKGKISSLNLSVAAGVVLYQILEKRESQRGESA